MFVSDVFDFQFVGKVEPYFLSAGEEVDDLTFSALTLETMVVNEKTKNSGQKAQRKKFVPKKAEPKTESNRKKDENNRAIGKRIDVGLQQTVMNVQNPLTKQHMTVNALIDTGSNHTAISKRLAEKLQLDGMVTPYRVMTYGGGIVEQKAKMVRVNLRSLDGKSERQLVIRSVDNLCGEMKVWPWNEFKMSWDHMRDIDFPKVVGDSKIDLLIGTENSDFVRVVAPDVVGRTPQEPVVRFNYSGPYSDGTFETLEWTYSRSCKFSSSICLSIQ